VSDRNLILLDGRTGPSETEPDERVVAMAREILRHAESGNLRGFVLCGELADTDVICIVSGSFRPFSMVGQLEFAKARVITSNIETPEDDG